MARFLIKASEFKNVCKAVNDRKLAELKKEIIEILKKQDEKEVKKAIDYFNSQELHYTHLEKSLVSGKWIEKAGYGVGTVRIWKGKKYKKIAPGKWARVFEKEGRGTNVAVGRLIAQIGKIDNIEDLEKFVAANKQRFVDENGNDLPILNKLRAASDIRNEKLSGESSSYTYGVGEDTSRAKNEIFAAKDKINAKEAELHKVSRKLSQVPTSELKQRKAKLDRWIENKTRNKRDSINNAIFKDSYKKEVDAINKELERRKDTSKPAEKKSPEKLLKEMGFETMEKVSFNGDKWEVAGVSLDYNGNANGISLTPDRQAGNLHSSNVTVFDIDKIQKNKPAERKKTFKQEMNELYDAQDKAWEGFESGSEIKSTPENSKKFYDRVKKFVEENNIKLTEKHRAEIEDQNGHSFNEALALAGAYGEENKKRALAKNRENAEKYKGSVLDLSQIDEFKESGTEEKKFTVIRGGKEIQIPESKIKENIDSLNEQIEDIERKLKDDSYKKNWKAYENEKKELQSTLEVQKDMLEKIKNGVYKEESEAEKTQNRSENARHFGTDWEESRKEIQSKLVENTDKLLKGNDNAKDVYEKLQNHLNKRKADAELYRKYLGNQEEPEDVKDFRKWCDDVIEQYKKEVTYTPSKEIISKWEETAKNTPTEKLEEVYNGKQKVDYSNEYENYIDSTIINTFAKDKDLVFPQPYTMLKDIATRKFDNSDKIRLEVIKKELESRKKGKNVEKSLFDDLFEIDIIAADELEDEEELKENETEYNDYTAEQPDLFNSPEFAVREALNRRFNCR